jgi:glycine/D-amino acid oxidase-like deaminating enzyme
MYGAIVIGGGFYGAAIASYLLRKRGLRKVALVEREPGLLKRASFNNQARIHNGYHYPRSFTTAFRSRVNLPRFVRDYPDALQRDFAALYAIARRNSKVTAGQFRRFCRAIGAKLEPAPRDLRALFEPRLIEDVFLAEEYVFDAARLAHWARRDLDEAGAELRFNTTVTGIYAQRGSLSLRCEGAAGGAELAASLVFNCTYSGLNRLDGEFPGTRSKLKHEITEIALMQGPSALQGVGITVMDGPFFSIMPFPARSMHALSHVRYTPHLNWEDSPGVDPYRRLERYEGVTRVERMVRDAARYLPAIRDARYVESLFEVKTVLVKNETDDGRPILFERHPDLPGCFSILGGKIDNVYDVLERLDTELSLER